MKTTSKKMAAEIVSALTEATLVRSSRKKIMKQIDDTAKKMVKKINKRFDLLNTNPKTNTKKKKQQKQAIKAGQNKATSQSTVS